MTFASRTRIAPLTDNHARPAARQEGDFEGEEIDGVREGHGVLRWPNGDVYEGGFVRGLRHGEGEYRLADGRT